MTATTTIPDRLLVKPREAARLLSVSPRTLFSLPIPKIKLGEGRFAGVRYDVDDLREWIDERKNSGSATSRKHSSPLEQPGAAR